MGQAFYFIIRLPQSENGEVPNDLQTPDHAGDVTVSDHEDVGSVRLRKFSHSPVPRPSSEVINKLISWVIDKL